MKAPFLLSILCLTKATFGFTSTPVSFAERKTLRYSEYLNKLAMAPSQEIPQMEPSSTAFVFIEYQNEFCSPGGKLYEAVKECMDQTGMLEKSIQTLNAARQAGCTIIHCPIDFEPGHHEIAKNPYGILAGIKEGGAFTSGQWGSQFVSGMQPTSGDLIVKGKKGLCGFASTNLEFLLGQSQSRNVILAGFLTNCCVESTMRTAYEKGFKVFTLKDCMAATSTAAQDATLEYNFGMFSVPTTSNDVISAIQRTATVA